MDGESNETREGGREGGREIQRSPGSLSTHTRRHAEDRKLNKTPIHHQPSTQELSFAATPTAP